MDPPGLVSFRVHCTEQRRQLGHHTIEMRVMWGNATKLLQGAQLVSDSNISSSGMNGLVAPE